MGPEEDHQRTFSGWEIDRVQRQSGGIRRFKSFVAVAWDRLRASLRCIFGIRCHPRGVKVVKPLHGGGVKRRPKLSLVTAAVD